MTTDRQLAFVASPWEAAFLAEVGQVRARLMIVCPFIKLPIFRKVLAAIPDFEGRHILVDVITRLNVRDCQANVHDIEVVSLLLQRDLIDGVLTSVRIDNSVHAKLVIVDSNRAIITSSNLTHSGLNTNKEVAACMSDPAVVLAAHSYFTNLFSSARIPTEEDVSGIKAALREQPRRLGTVSWQIPTDIVDGSELPQAVDSQALVRIAQAMEADVTKDLLSGIRELGTLHADSMSSLDEGEHAFIAERRARFLEAFGSPVPSDERAATLWIHRSASQSTKVFSPNMDLQESLVQIGLLAGTTAIRVVLATRLAREQTINDIDSLSRWLASDTYVCQKFEALGLCAVIVGPGWHRGGDRDDVITLRVGARVGWSLIGHLFETRSWNDFLSILDDLFDLRESGSWSISHTVAFKTELQHVSQRVLGDAPRYEIMERTGENAAPIFRVRALVGGRTLSEGTGRSLREAEDAAAANALQALGSSALLGGSVSPRKLSGKVPAAIESALNESGGALIRQVSGKDLSDRSLRAVLIPVSKVRDKSARLREVLAGVGGWAKQILFLELLATRDSGDTRWTVARSTAAKRHVNSDALEANLLQTPVGEWLRWCSTFPEFSDCLNHRPLRNTANALIGATLLEHGLDGTRQLARVIFGDPAAGNNDGDAVRTEQTSRGRLLHVVQDAYRDRTSEVFSDVVVVHGPHHRQEFSARYILEGTEIGAGTGRSKKGALEAAALAALTSPSLSPILVAARVRAASNEGVSRPKRMPENE